MPTYLLTIAYDGARFHGWQRQLGVRTVQEELEKACAAIDLPGTHVEGAGRTDTGVHAFGQCAHIRIDREFPPAKLQLALNSNLPEDVAVQKVIEAPEGFHARFYAGGKRYLYRVVCSPVKPAVGRPYFHWSRRAVDLDAMRRAMQCLRGEHDFASFATNPGYARSRGTVRTLQHLHLVRRRDGFDFVVQGSGFLYNMVRNIAGTLLDVGRGRLEPGAVARALASGQRTDAGPTAPAEGLYLLRVLYDEPLFPGRDAGLRGAAGAFPI